jgi:hypothetical protein
MTSLQAAVALAAKVQEKLLALQTRVGLSERP